MALRRSVLAGAWVLVALNLLLAFGAIALLTRMSPAIATILEQNDFSLEACEDMIEVLALPPESRGLPPARKAFFEALNRVETNVTEEDERPVIARVRARAGAALAGDADAVRDEVAALEVLASINRRAMRRADVDAQRMGFAGAWGVVFMAVLSFLVSLMLVRMLRGRVLAPIEELLSVIRARERGDAHRRCSNAGAPVDFRTIFAEVNALLDEISAAEPRRNRSGREGAER